VAGIVLALLILIGADATNWQNRAISLKGAVGPKVTQELINTDRPTTKQSYDTQEQPYDLEIKVLTLLFGAATLGVIGFQAWIYWRQSGLMKGMRNAADLQAATMVEQRGIMTGQLAAATTAANAAAAQADTAKRALFRLERPYVFVEIGQFRREPPWLKFSYGLVNHGKTPAIIRMGKTGHDDIGRFKNAEAFDAAWVVASERTEYGLKNYMEPDVNKMQPANTISNIIIPAGEAFGPIEYTITFGMTQPKIDDRIITFSSEGRRLYFMAYITYTGPLQDAQDAPHVTASMHRIKGYGADIISEEYGGGKYNYRT
jgi:hypothetical protein